jgi:hypothetical protein
VTFFAILPADVAAQTAQATTQPTTVGGRTLAPQLLTRLAATKTKASPQQLASMYAVAAGRPTLKLANGRTIVLDPPTQTFAVPTALRPKTSPPAAVSKYAPYYKTPSVEPLSEKPAVVLVSVDHSPRQTPVKDQRGRGSCVSFAVSGAMESFLNWKTNKQHDISEEHMFKLFKDSKGANCNEYGFFYTAAWEVLAQNKVCGEAQQPYADPSQCVISTACSNAKAYSLKDVSIITNTPPENAPGWYASNTKVLESLIDAGFDVSIGAGVAGTGWSGSGAAATGIIDVELKGDGTPLEPSGSHAMNVVGYHRPGGYFIVKNSWGTDWGRSGYARFSYDYMQTYVNGALVVTDAGYTPVMQAAANVTTTVSKPPPAVVAK